jgi:ABC-type enterochelin transport system permease subunit
VLTNVSRKKKLIVAFATVLALILAALFYSYLISLPRGKAFTIILIGVLIVTIVEFVSVFINQNKDK